MKGMFLAVCAGILMSGGVHAAEIKGIVSTVDANTGTLEISGVEVVINEDWTIIENHRKIPAVLGNLGKGDYIEVEGRFIDPARFEATRITVVKDISTASGEEAAEKAVGVEDSQPEPATAAREAETVPTKTHAAGGDTIRGSIRNVDVKTRILIVGDIVVNLDTDARIQGASGKAVTLARLRRGDRVECEGTRLSKKDFKAGSVQVLK